MTDANLDIAALLLDLSEVYRPAPKFWGYKNASRSIRRHPEFLSDLTEKEILKIAGVGPASLRVVREFLDAGESPTVDAHRRARAAKPKRSRRGALLRRNFLSAAMVRKVLAEPKRGAVKREEYFGDFQMHSRGSDGTDTIEMLAKGCMKRGYRCMCVTDHSYGLPIAGGMKMDEMRAQHAEIDKLNKKFGGEFRVFKGVEANILQDGSLDMDPSELPEFDLVVASPHSSLRKSIDQTERMLKAVSTPGVHILGHPRGRMFNSRAGVIADWPSGVQARGRNGRRDRARWGRLASGSGLSRRDGGEKGRMCLRSRQRRACRQSALDGRLRDRARETGRNSSRAASSIAGLRPIY